MGSTEDEAKKGTFEAKKGTFEAKKGTFRYEAKKGTFRKLKRGHSVIVIIAHLLAFE